MKYKYYNFPDKHIRMSACFLRVMTYFGLKVYNQEKTVDSLFDNLKKNDIKYDIMKFDESETYKKGILFFESPSSSHIAIFENGVYYDSFDHIARSHIAPTYMIIFL